MDERFRAHVESLHERFEALVGQTPVMLQALPKEAEKSGIYLLSEGPQDLYVGRSKNIRKRLKMHVGHYAGASFAVKLARLATGRKTSYTTKDSTKQLMSDPAFLQCFVKPKTGFVKCRSGMWRSRIAIARRSSKFTPL